MTTNNLSVTLYWLGSDITDIGWRVRDAGHSTVARVFFVAGREVQNFGMRLYSNAR